MEMRELAPPPSLADRLFGVLCAHPLGRYVCERCLEHESGVPLAVIPMTIAELYGDNLIHLNRSACSLCERNDYVVRVPRPQEAA